MSEKLRGRVTIPTDVDVVPETLELVKRWGARWRFRYCDGTDYPGRIERCRCEMCILHITQQER